MNFIAVFSFVASLYPVIVATVKEVENSGVSGADKKAAVMAAIAATINGLAAAGIKLPASVQSLLTVAGPIIDAVVTAFNVVGLFTHKTAAAPVTTAK
jgi:hypothetical protein